MPYITEAYYNETFHGEPVYTLPFSFGESGRGH